MNPQECEKHIRHRFDNYCKRILKRSALDYHRALKRQTERKVVFSDLSARDMAKPTTANEYFRDEYVFDVRGESVNVSDTDLAEPLNVLPAVGREIVLMSYFFDMTDKEIAERLDLTRRTVAYRRTNTLKALKSILGNEV
jgi:RNA polymerase sigma factor (sigma-70 family)